MRTAILCSCGRDDSKGRWLAEFLERNCAVRVSLEEGRIRPGFDLIEAAATAISADVAIVLLSPDSVPPVWARERWEPVFLEEAGSFGTRETEITRESSLSLVGATCLACGNKQSKSGNDKVVRKFAPVEWALKKRY